MHPLNQKTIDRIPERFLEWFERTYAGDCDKIDLEGEYSEELSIEENMHHFLKSFGCTALELAPQKPTPSDVQRLELDHAESQAPRESDADFVRMLKGAKVISISGAPGEGKTSLAMRCLDTLYATEHKRPCVYKHPLPSALPLHYKNLYTLAELEDLHDCSLYVDEPDVVLSRYEHHAATALMNLLTLCRQRNITIILSTSNSRYLTSSIESFVSVFLVKSQEPELIKRGSITAKIIKNNVFIDVSGFHLPVNQFLYYCRDKPELSGRHSFKLPDYWTRQLSTPYMVSSQSERTPNPQRR